MNKYFVIQPKTMVKIMECFSSNEEFDDFCQSLSFVIDEMIFTGKVIERNSQDKEFVTKNTIKQLFLFGLFCREHMEIIHELVNTIEYQEVSSEQMKDLNEQDPKGNLDRLEP